MKTRGKKTPAGAGGNASGKSGGKSSGKLGIPPVTSGAGGPPGSKPAASGKRGGTTQAGGGRASKVAKKGASAASKEIVITAGTKIYIESADDLSAAEKLFKKFSCSPSQVRFLYKLARTFRVDADKFGTCLFSNLGFGISPFEEQVQPKCVVGDELLPVGKKKQPFVLAFLENYLPICSTAFKDAKNVVHIPGFLAEILKVFLTGNAHDAKGWLKGAIIQIDAEMVGYSRLPLVAGKLIDDVFVNPDINCPAFIPIWAIYHQWGLIAIQEIAVALAVLFANAYSEGQILNLSVPKDSKITELVQLVARAGVKLNVVESADAQEQSSDESIDHQVDSKIQSVLASRLQSPSKQTNSRQISGNSPPNRTPIGQVSVEGLVNLQKIFGEYVSKEFIIELGRAAYGAQADSIGTAYELACHIDSALDKFPPSRLSAAACASKLERKKSLLASFLNPLDLASSQKAPKPQDVLPNLESPADAQRPNSQARQVSPPENDDEEDDDTWSAFIKRIAGEDEPKLWNEMFQIVSANWANANRYAIAETADWSLKKIHVITFLGDHPDDAFPLSKLTNKEELLMGLLQVKNKLDERAKTNLHQLQQPSVTIYNAPSPSPTAPNKVPQPVIEAVSKTQLFQQQLEAVQKVDSMAELSSLFKELHDIPRVALMGDIPQGTSHSLKSNIEAAKRNIIIVLRKYIKTQFSIELDETSLINLFHGSLVDDLNSKTSYFKLTKFHIMATPPKDLQLKSLAAHEIKLAVSRLLHVFALIWPTDDVAPSLLDMAKTISLANISPKRFDEIVIGVILRPLHDQCLNFRTAAMERTRPSLANAVEIVTKNYCKDDEDIQALIDSIERQNALSPIKETSTGNSSHAEKQKIYLELDSSSDDEQDTTKSKQSSFDDAWQHALAKLPTAVRIKYEKKRPNEIIINDERCLSRIYLNLTTRTLHSKNFDKCAIADAEGKPVDDLCFPYITASRTAKARAKCTHTNTQAAHFLSESTFKRIQNFDTNLITVTDLN
mmetsp:Transcript_16263/g.21271  ORF Transcript_16263/g.21271 Transcript_16263/m.21271 type:complete len:1011 (+) Transcript_16263:86-3118(+)